MRLIPEPPGLIAGGAIIYSFWLILATLSFWFVRVENILEIFRSMYEAGRWPDGPDVSRSECGLAEIKKFLGWALKEGQGYAKGLYYAPLPRNVITMCEKLIASINA